MPRKEIQNVLNGKDRKAFISARSLKHIYDRHIFDKKASRDFYFILDNLSEIVRYPDGIYLNTKGKRGDFLITKEIREQLYMCTLEIISDSEMEIVSACTTGEKYIKRFALLWS